MLCALDKSDIAPNAAHKETPEEDALASEMLICVTLIEDWYSRMGVFKDALSNAGKSFLHNSTHSTIMAKNEEKLSFEKDEKVLCYHGPFIYEAKVNASA